MPLDELHARKLATVVTVVEKALDRIELVRRGIKKVSDSTDSKPPLTAGQIRQIRERIEAIRKRTSEGSRRFAIRGQKPEPRRILAAELSALWVVLESARPERMKGYGREFDVADRRAWEDLIQGLLLDLEHLRSLLSLGH